MLALVDLVVVNSFLPSLTFLSSLTPPTSFYIFLEYQDETQDNLSPEQIKMETHKWIQRSLYSSIAVVSLWAVWIVVFIVCADKFNPNWYVRSQDEAERTGW